MRPRRVPGADDHGLPARGPPAAPRVRRPGREKRSTRSRPAPGACAAVVGFPRVGARPATTRRPCARTVACTACTASSCSRTTRCSTSSATSRRRPIDGPLFVVAGVRVGVSICEDAWSPTARSSPQAAGGAEVVVNLNALAVLRGPARTSARRCSRRARPTRRCRSSTRTSSAARTSSCSTARRSCSTSRACSWRGRASSTRTCSSSTSTCARRSASACSTRVARARSPPLAEVDGHRGAARRARRRTARRAAARAGARGVRSARARHARLRRARTGSPTCLIGLSGGIDSSLVAAIAVDALGAEHVVGRAHAVALLERRQRHRRRRARREPRHPHVSRSRSSPRTPRSRRCSRRCSPAPSPASPRRTCRPASAATCSWRSRTSSAGWCSPPATRARWRPATPRSTATWPAASR